MLPLLGTQESMCVTETPWSDRHIMMFHKEMQEGVISSKGCCNCNNLSFQKPRRTAWAWGYPRHTTAQVPFDISIHGLNVYVCISLQGRLLVGREKKVMFWIISFYLLPKSHVSRLMIIIMKFVMNWEFSPRLKTVLCDNIALWFDFVL